MEEGKRIADQLRRSMQGMAWHGPAVLELLRDIPAEKAAAPPAIIGAHNIWEIALHIGAWLAAAQSGLDGHPVDIPAERDWPAAIDTSAVAWQHAVENLARAQNELCDRIAQLSESQLAELVTGTARFSVYFLLHGLVQHNTYHAGQIALLKKS